jgi:hypothetical protein
MKLFNLVNNKIEFDTSLLIIPEFNKIWVSDKSKDKDKAFKQFAVIYFMVDSNSPYSNFPLESKKTMVFNDMFKGEVNETADLKNAMLKYTLLSETPTQRLLMSVKMKIDGIANFLNNSETNEETLPAILKAIESTSKLVGQLSILEDAVNKEKASAKDKRTGEKRTRLYEDD